MNKKSFYTAIILSLFILGVVGVYYSVVSKQNQSGDQTVSQETYNNTITISIDYVVQDKSLEFVENETVLSSLKRLSVENNFELKLKEYPGLGTLVEGIGNHINGDDEKYWQYTVNNLMPQVGADLLIVSPGDYVVWEFKKSEF